MWEQASAAVDGAVRDHWADTRVDYYDDYQEEEDEDYDVEEELYYEVGA